MSRVAVITGAGRGIGRATALRLAAGGAHVAVLDVDAGRAASVVDELRGLGATAVPIVADLADVTAVQAAAAAIEREFGKVDILVNNAGVVTRGHPFELDDADYRQMVGVNLDGVWFASKYIGPLIGAGGSIVNVASAVVIQTTYNRAVYTATKGAVLALTRALAFDLSTRRIRVNAVIPGPTDTEIWATADRREEVQEELRAMTPLGKWAKPADIAAAIAFLSSDEASHITGVALPVDGGFTLGNAASSERHSEDGVIGMDDE